MKSSPWIVRRRPNDSPALRLFCFPHAGAGSVIYRDWSTSFADSIDVCAIEPPGRLARRHEPSAASVAEFVSTFDAAVEPFLDVPFAVFGYSLGALMAFEWLRSVRRQRKLRATQLVVAACPAPQLKRRLGPISHEPKPVLVRELESRYGPFEPILKEDPALFDLILQIMRRDLKTLEDYAYPDAAPLECPILAIGGDNDVSVLPEELQGWSAQTTANFRATWLPGDHFFMKNRGAELRQLVREHLGPAPTAAA